MLANMIACNSVDSSADTVDRNNNISQDQVKYWPEAELGNYGMNHLNLLLEYFTVPIRNVMLTTDDQLCMKEFKLLAYIKNQNRFTGHHSLSLFEDV